MKDNVHILVIGDIIVDRYITGTSTRMSVEAPVPILDYKNEELRLGGAGNVALNIKHLDSSCKVSLMGVVGDDYYGQWVVDELENYDIDDYLSVDFVVSIVGELALIPAESVELLGSSQEY